MADSENTSLVADFYDFAGIDHYTSPFLVKENKLAQCVNFMSTGNVGGKSTRPPFGLFLNNPDNNKVRNLIYFVYQNSNGTSTGYLIRISGSHIYSYQVGSGANTWGSPLSLPAALTDTTTPFGYAVLANKLHLSNGTDNYMTWDPINGFVADPAAPKARSLTVYQRRIYATNVPGATSREYYSSVDYTGAPSESTTLTSSYAAGVTSVQVNANVFSGASVSAPIQTVLGTGTANAENVNVTGVSGSASPYTLTLQSTTTKTHSSGDVVTNNAPWYSDPNNASTANYFDVDPEHNGAVIGNDVVNNNLTMHKSTGGIYLYNGTAIGNPLQSTNPFFNAPGDVSSISPYAFDQISGIELFPSFDGIYAFQGGYPNNISLEIYDLFQNMTGSQRAVAAGIAFQNKYYYSMGTVKDKYGETITNCVVVYDFLLNIFETYSFSVLPTTWCIMVDGNGNQQLMFGDASGNTYQWNTGIGDNNAASTAILQTHYLNFGAPERTKDITGYQLNTNPGSNFQFQADLDFKGDWKTITTASGLGISDNAPAWLKNFKSIAFRIIAETTVPMTFYGFTLKVNVGSKRVSGRRI